MSKSQPTFLIRSAGQILGPYSKKEVIALIKRGKIAISDEVAQPFSIWWYVQDHSEFKDVIQSLDVSTRVTNFLTQISQKITNTSQNKKNPDRTVTDTKEQTVDTKSLSKEMEVVQLEHQDKQQAHEVQVKGLDSSSTKPSTDIKYRSQGDSEEIIRTRINRIVKIFWYTIVFCSLSIGGYIFYKEIIIPIQRQKTTRDEFANNAMRFYKAGDYKEALPFFEEAYSKNILQASDKLLLASLFLYNNKLQKASVIINEISGGKLQNSGNWFLLKGLLSFYQNDFESAEVNFESAQQKKKTLAFLNLSLLKWKTGDYKKSLQYLDRLIEIGYERGIVFYLKALNLLYQNQIQDLSLYLNQELSFHQPASFIKEYRQEFYLMQAYSYLKEGKTEKLEESIRNLLNEDPFFSTKYQYSSFIAIQTLNWENLQPYCKDIFDSNTQDNLFNALYGFCQLKISQFHQGAKYIEQAKNGTPTDPLFLSLYAYYLMLEKKNIQLKSALTLIDYDHLQARQTLPFIIKARFLEEQQDWGRSMMVWKDLLNKSSTSLSGLAGVAEASFQLGDLSTAEIYKKEGIREYPYHVRLLFYDHQEP